VPLQPFSLVLFVLIQRAEGQKILTKWDTTIIANYYGLVKLIFFNALTLSATIEPSLPEVNRLIFPFSGLLRAKNRIKFEA
jgi:hypothetical protein